MCKLLVCLCSASNKEGSSKRFTMMEVRWEAWEYFCFFCFLWITCMHKEVKEKRALEWYILLQPTLMMLNITSKVLVFPPFLFRQTLLPSTFNLFAGYFCICPFQIFESLILINNTCQIEPTYCRAKSSDLP